MSLSSIIRRTIFGRIVAFMTMFVSAVFLAYGAKYVHRKGVHQAVDALRRRPVRQNLGYVGVEEEERDALPSFVSVVDLAELKSQLDEHATNTVVDIKRVQDSSRAISPFPCSSGYKGVAKSVSGRERRFSTAGELRLCVRGYAIAR